MGEAQLRSEVEGRRVSAMLAGVQPCFQLLRIGSSDGDSARDLYTFRPALSQSVFRLGRAAELCDVTLDSESVSRIHAELYAEKEASGEGGGREHQEESWTVHVKDRSSHGNSNTHTHDDEVEGRES